MAPYQSKVWGHGSMMYEVFYDLAAGGLLAALAILFMKMRRRRAKRKRYTDINNVAYIFGKVDKNTPF